MRSYTRQPPSVSTACIWRLRTWKRRDRTRERPTRPGTARKITALGDRLMRRGVVADVFIVGGAATALAYDATRVTRDVDSPFVPHGVVLEEARNVARDLGLPTWWLNEQASVYISGKDDPGKRRRARLGLPIQGFDALIAAICRAHGAALATRNVKDFAETGIEIVDPWSARG